MVRCKCAIYLQIDFVLDRLQIEEPMGKTIYMSKQPRTIDWLSDQGWATYPRAVGPRQSKWLIWERSDRDQLTQQLVEHEHELQTPLLRSELVRGLEAAKGQGPTVEALKIQKVQKVDIGR